MGTKIHLSKTPFTIAAPWIDYAAVIWSRSRRHANSTTTTGTLFDTGQNHESHNRMLLHYCKLLWNMKLLSISLHHNGASSTKSCKLSWNTSLHTSNPHDGTISHHSNITEQQKRSSKGPSGTTAPDPRTGSIIYMDSSGHNGHIGAAIYSPTVHH